jgi:hypothetical protein
MSPIYQSSTDPVSMGFRVRTGSDWLCNGGLSHVNAVKISGFQMPSISGTVNCRFFSKSPASCSQVVWKIKVKLSLCLTNWALRHEDLRGTGCIDPRFLDVGTSCRWVVSLTPRTLYPRYPLERRLDGPQSRSGRRVEEKILDTTGSRTPTPR